MRDGLPALTTAAVLLLAACASRPPVLSQLMPETRAAVELTDTPFFPQAKYQCGPAALATVLHSAGVAVQPETLVDQVYLPAKRGSLQVELQAATRRAGRIPFVIDTGLDALRAELDAGRPVLVLQNLGLGFLPVWHYAVVVGIDPASDQVILRSGVERRRVSSAASFLRSWQLSGNWAMVVLVPGEMPAAPEAQQRYLTAVALAEPMLPTEERIRAYLSALQRWPASATARFGYAHALHESGELAAAEDAYRNIVTRNPRHAAAYNNLALVLSDRGCHEQARAAASRALDIATVDQPALVEPINETLRGISATSTGQHRCRP
jgi:tetratricopeptide (TPR) repeat protein